MGKIYCGVNNYSKEANQIYVGVNGKSRKVEKKIYVGVNGISKQLWPVDEEPIECEHNWVFDCVNKYDLDPGQEIWEYEEI